MIKLSYVESKAYTGFKKHIGRTPTGSPKCFYFGKDRSTAELKAIALLTAWRTLEASGQTHWSQEAIQNVLQAFGEGQGMGSLVPQEKRVSVAAIAKETLHDAITEYVSQIEAKTTIGRAYRAVMVERIEAVRAVMEDRPLCDVGYDQIVALINHFAARPKGKLTRTPISPDTAMNYIAALKYFLIWCEDSQRWTGPHRWERLFKVRKASLIHDGEELEDNRTFSIDELKIIWDACHERGQTYMALTLNTGMLSTDMSKLMRSHVDLNAGIIARKRSKTQKAGRWELWDVTARLLGSQAAENGDRMLLNEHGKPLVQFSERGNKTDCVGLYFKRLLEGLEGDGKLKLDGRSFKHLRKTGASLVHEASGSIEVARLFLAHSGRSVAERHYLPRHYDGLDVALAKVRFMLTPVVGQVQTVASSAA